MIILSLITKYSINYAIILSSNTCLRNSAGLCMWSAVACLEFCFSLRQCHLLFAFSFRHKDMNYQKDSHGCVTHSSAERKEHRSDIGRPQALSLSLSVLYASEMSESKLYCTCAQTMNQLWKCQHGTFLVTLPPTGKEFLLVNQIRITHLDRAVHSRITTPSITL